MISKNDKLGHNGTILEQGFNLEILLLASTQRL